MLREDSRRLWKTGAKSQVFEKTQKGNQINKGEVTVLVPVPDFKSAVSRLRSGKVSSILMLSRQ